MRLVGYARANGDGALVATVHDVAVIPALRGRGLGRALLRRLMKQVLCMCRTVQAAAWDCRLGFAPMPYTLAHFSRTTIEEPQSGTGCNTQR